MTETFMWLLSDKLSLVMLMIACILLLFGLMLITRFNPVTFGEITVSPRARTFGFTMATCSISIVAAVALIAIFTVRNQRDPKTTGTLSPTAEKQDVRNTAPSTDAGSAQQPSTEWCAEHPSASCFPKICNEHHLTIVIMSAEWCGPCRKFEKYTLTDPAVQARLESGNYGIVKVDLDTNRAIVNKYRVQAVPTIIFLTQDCEELGRSVGGKDADDFLQLLDTADEKAKKK